MAIEGQLQDVSLADICQLLALGRKTGCLTVTDRSNFGYVYFEEGRVVHASVLNRPDRLGELLVRNGVITREELSQAMEQQAREPGRRLGRILVARGSLDEEELMRYIAIQVEEAVYHLFAWERGSFQFDPDALPDREGASRISINAESLLLEGARRVDESSEFEKKISSRDLIFSVERDPSNDPDVELTEAQRKILPLLDGERTVEGLIGECGLVEFDAMKALYGLIQAGFVRRSGRGELREGGEEAGEVPQHLNLGAAYYRAGMFEDAEREYRKVVDREPGHGPARSRLALIALRHGRPEEAIEHYEAAPEETSGSYAGLRNRAWALEILDRYDEALALLDRATELRGGDGDLLLARAILLYKSGRPARAMDLFRRFAAELPRREIPPAIFYAYALLAATGAGDRGLALRLGREGVNRYPREASILVNLGAVLEWQGEAAAAEALYLRAVQESPVPPQAHKNLGDLAYRRGDQAGARAHFERAVRIEPGLGDDLYLKLGNLAYKEGDGEWAIQHWRKALELNPRNEVVRTNLELVGAASGS